MRHWPEPSIFQATVCRLLGAKPLSELMMTYCQLDPTEHMSMKYHLKCKSFLSRKCIWECRLQMTVILSRPQRFKRSRKKNIYYLIIEQYVWRWAVPKARVVYWKKSNKYKCSACKVRTFNIVNTKGLVEVHIILWQNMGPLCKWLFARNSNHMEITMCYKTCHAIYCHPIATKFRIRNHSTGAMPRGEFCSTKDGNKTGFHQWVEIWWESSFTPIHASVLRQNGCHFADDIFKCIFLNENFRIHIQISLKFVPKGPNNNIPALVQIMVWRRPGDKPSSEPMLTRLTYAYIRHYG